jgi:hypothetical protein
MKSLIYFQKIIITIIMMTIPVSSIMASSCDNLPPPPPKNYDITTIIFVSGFNASRIAREFTPELQKWFKQIPDFHVRIKNHGWKSRKMRRGSYLIDAIKMPERWNEANKKAVREVSRLSRRIKSYEKKGKSYYLIGYGLGTKVILKSLEKQKKRLNNLKGIYFLGTTLAKNSKLRNPRILPKGIKIINFYSPKYDNVLKSLTKITKTKIAGITGFKNHYFQNFKTDSSHSPRDDECNFFNLADSIGYFIAYNEGYTIANKKIDCNLSSTPRNRWNNIIDLGKAWIQQNSCPESANYFRIVDKKSNNVQSKDCNLHHLIKVRQEKGPL